LKNIEAHVNLLDGGQYLGLDRSQVRNGTKHLDVSEDHGIGVD
jgi:hypothetical protein